MCLGADLVLRCGQGQCEQLQLDKDSRERVRMLQQLIERMYRHYGVLK